MTWERWKEGTAQVNGGRGQHRGEGKTEDWRETKERREENRGWDILSQGQLVQLTYL